MVLKMPKVEVSFCGIDSASADGEDRVYSTRIARYEGELDDLMEKVRRGIEKHRPRMVQIMFE